MQNTDSSVKNKAKDRFKDLTPLKLNEVEKQSVIALAISVLAEQHLPGQTFSSPKETSTYLRLHLADRQNEIFGCLFLDNRHRILAMYELFQGTIDGASVHPRVVVQQAMKTNAAAVVFFHNHPSGVAEPSLADETITRRLKEALALVDVRVFDHFVVSFSKTVSFVERGLL